jgi:predicted Rossmann fold flavoprotein
VHDVLVIGAGAAGLMAAIEAGRRGRRVVLLERSDRPGKKILISGGGRCNFTNLHCRPENFLSANPHFAKSALARYTPADFIALVERYGIRYHEKTLGQLFCDGPADQIVSMLLAECAAANVRIVLGADIRAVTRTDDFEVTTQNSSYRAPALIIATGGLSIPKLGATSFGYDLARQFNHPIIDPRPALVPLVLNPEDQSNWCDLTGLSTEVIASLAPTTSLSGVNAKPRTVRSTFREKLLITHRGLSGPAILQLSSYWRPNQPITLDLAPSLSSRSGAEGSASASASVFTPLLTSQSPRLPSHALEALRQILPARLAERWLAHHLPPQTQLLSNAAIARLEEKIHSTQFIPAATEGFAKAEVTAGGVSTSALDARTMQSRLVPGLYFIGEVVDVTGWLGGYNFQWAWSSAHAAAQSV